jgi:thioredoxin reductase (NADPH)
VQKKTLYDVVILGSGPAGLQAAIHASRKKVSVLVLGRQSKSSLFYAHVENFCSLFKVSGEEILRTGRQQAQEFGAKFLEEDVLHITPTSQLFEIKVESGDAVQSKALIIATGTARNKLGVAGEKAFLGKGVSYCVECDANFYKGEDVAIIGGESAAADGALTLTHSAKTVHLISEKLQMVDTLKEELQKSNVIIHEGYKVREIGGDNQVQEIVLDNGTRIPVSGAFIELGAKGVMELAFSLNIALDDEMKFIQTNKKFETNVPGIFAAGDVCGPPWQMAKAVGEGCVAGIGAANYAKKLKLTE